MMHFTDETADPAKKHTYRIITVNTVNTVGLKSD